MEQQDIFRRIQESFDRQNFLRYIGAELVSVEAGKVVTACRNRPELTQQQGFLHGGVITSLADITCGYTALSVMPPEREVLSVEFKVNILRPVRSERIVAVGSVVKAGRKLVITEASVYEDEAYTGKLCAKMLGTMIPTER